MTVSASEKTITPVTKLFVHSALNRCLRALALILLIIVFFPAACPAVEPGNALWSIVSTCLDTNAPDYCAQCPFPRTESVCASGRGCEDTTEVWQETAKYAVIRDKKMCGCQEGLIHGLVIPRERISGIEAPRKPESIWNLAWAAAKKRIKDENAVALAVNPKGSRTQDQLHVHILRLTPDARQRFEKARLVRVQSLDTIWRDAEQKAALLGLKDYGVLVTKNPEGGFLVLIEGKSPEKLYTEWKCR